MAADQVGAAQQSMFIINVLTVVFCEDHVGLRSDSHEQFPQRTFPQTSRATSAQATVSRRPPLYRVESPRAVGVAPSADDWLMVVGEGEIEALLSLLPAAPAEGVPAPAPAVDDSVTLPVTVLSPVVVRTAQQRTRKNTASRRHITV
jgi:hypothetical protein